MMAVQAGVSGEVMEPAPLSQPREKSGRGGKRSALKLAAVTVALGSVATFAAAPQASANTPSDYSHTFYVGATPSSGGLPITVGWTNDHAWVISSYGAAMSAGSGLIASQLCSVASGETGPLNPVGRACSTLATQVVSSLAEGHPALTDHGLWMAYYVWPQSSTSGTW